MATASYCYLVGGVLPAVVTAAFEHRSNRQPAPHWLPTPLGCVQQSKGTAWMSRSPVWGALLGSCRVLPPWGESCVQYGYSWPHPAPLHWWGGPICRAPWCVQAGQVCNEFELWDAATAARCKRPLEEILTLLRKVHDRGWAACCSFYWMESRLSWRHCGWWQPSWSELQIPSAPTPLLPLQGSLLLKHGRQGKPKVHYFRLAASDTILKWKSASGSVRQVKLRTVTELVPGQTTDVFKRHMLRETSFSFSLKYTDDDGRWERLCVLGVRTARKGGSVQGSLGAWCSVLVTYHLLRTSF